MAIIATIPTQAGQAAAILAVRRRMVLAGWALEGEARRLGSATLRHLAAELRTIAVALEEIETAPQPSPISSADQCQPR